MIFELEPYAGADPIIFGINREELQENFGEPIRTTKNIKGEPVLYFPDFSVTFGKENRLLEATFKPSVQLFYCGLNIFDCNSISKLRSVDCKILEYVGILLLPEVGITASGLHNEEEKTVTIFSRGRIDHLLPKFREI